jgi:hypothetical protein
MELSHNVQGYSVTLSARLYVRVGISLRGEVWTHGAGLTPQPFIEMPVPSKESKRSCICCK